MNIAELLDGIRDRQFGMAQLVEFAIVRRRAFAEFSHFLEVGPANHFPALLVRKHRIEGPQPRVNSRVGLLHPAFEVFQECRATLGNVPAHRIDSRLRPCHIGLARFDQGPPLRFKRFDQSRRIACRFRLIEVVIDGLDILGPSIAGFRPRGRTGLLEGELRIGHTTLRDRFPGREPKAFILCSSGRDFLPQLRSPLNPRLNVFRFRRRFQGLPEPSLGFLFSFRAENHPRAGMNGLPRLSDHPYHHRRRKRPDHFAGKLGQPPAFGEHFRDQIRPGTGSRRQRGFNRRELRWADGVQLFDDHTGNIPHGLIERTRIRTRFACGYGSRVHVHHGIRGRTGPANDFRPSQERHVRADLKPRPLEHRLPQRGRTKLGTLQVLVDPRRPHEWLIAHWEAESLQALIEEVDHTADPMIEPCRHQAHFPKPRRGDLLDFGRRLLLVLW